MNYKMLTQIASIEIMDFFAMLPKTLTVLKVIVLVINI